MNFDGKKYFFKNCWVYLVGILLQLSTNSAFGQSQLVLNGNVFVVIDNSAKLVLDNGNSNALLHFGTGGIISEGEFDQVIWNIASNTGVYSVPFSTNLTLNSIPFTANITVPGSGSGKIAFSTYSGPNWDNNNYKPSDVTHLYDYSSGSVNNSNHVIDRFWIIDAQNYSIKPTAIFTFTYSDIEHSISGNSIVEAGLGAQRFNSTTNQWGDYLPQGITDESANTTSNVIVSPSNFFRSWTLVENLLPLSTELISFSFECMNQSVVFNWNIIEDPATDYFTIDRIESGDEFLIAKLSSTFNQLYSFQSSTDLVGIFKLSDVTVDGVKTEKALLSVDCMKNHDWISFKDGVLLITKTFGQESCEPLSIFDANGKSIYNEKIMVNKGKNHIQLSNLNLETSLYFVCFGSDEKALKSTIYIYKND